MVASPRPQRIFEIRPVQWLLTQGTVVICAGGGGIPTCYNDEGLLTGVEAVIDKDLCSALLARELEADLLVIATDVDGAYVHWGTPEQRAIATAHPDALTAFDFAEGSMGPKIQAACEFARSSGKTAVIGALADVEAIVHGQGGTRISTVLTGLVYRD